MQAAEYRALLTPLFARYVDPTLDYCRRNFKTVVPLPAVNQVGGGGARGWGAWLGAMCCLGACWGRIISGGGDRGHTAVHRVHQGADKLAAHSSSHVRTHAPLHSLGPR